MIVKVMYTEPHISEIEIDETMIRELYNQFHNINKVLNVIDDYIVKESGYYDNDGRDFEYLDEIDDYVCEVIEKIKEEEK